MIAELEKELIGLIIRILPALGFLFGYFLSVNLEEEINVFRKYLPLINWTGVILVVLFLLTEVTNYNLITRILYFILILLSAVFSVLLFISWKKHSLKHLQNISYLNYLVILIHIITLIISQNYFIIAIFSFFSFTCLANLNKKDWKKTAIHAVFFLIFLIISFFFYFLITPGLV